MLEHALRDNEPKNGEQLQFYQGHHLRGQPFLPPVPRHARSHSLAAVDHHNHACTETADDLGFLRCPDLSASGPVSSACSSSKPQRKPRALQSSGIVSSLASPSDSDSDSEHSRKASKTRQARSKVARAVQFGETRPSSRASARTNFKSKTVTNSAKHSGSEGLIASVINSTRRARKNQSRMEDNDFASFIQPSNPIELNEPSEHIGLGTGIFSELQSTNKNYSNGEIADEELYATHISSQGQSNLSSNNALLNSEEASSFQSGDPSCKDPRFKDPRAVGPYPFDPYTAHNPDSQRPPESVETNEGAPYTTRNFLQFSLSPDMQRTSGQLQQRFQFPPQRGQWQTQVPHSQPQIQVKPQQLQSSQSSQSFPTQQTVAPQIPLQSDQPQFTNPFSEPVRQPHFGQDPYESSQRLQNQHNLQQQVQQQQIQVGNYQQQKLQRQYQQQQPQQQTQPGVPQSPTRHSSSSSQSSSLNSLHRTHSRQPFLDSRMDDDDDDEDYLPPDDPNRREVAISNQLSPGRADDSLGAHQRSRSNSSQRSSISMTAQDTTRKFSSSVLHDGRIRNGGVHKPDVREVRQSRSMTTERRRGLTQDISGDVTKEGEVIVKREPNSQIPGSVTAEENLVPPRRGTVSSSGVALRSAQADARRNETSISAEMEDVSSAPADKLSIPRTGPSTPSPGNKTFKSVGEQTLSLAGLPSGPPASHSLAYKSKYMYEEPERHNLVLPHEASLSLRELSAKLQANNGLPEEDAMDVPGPDYPEEAVTAEWSPQDDEELLQLLDAAERHKWRYVSELMTEKQQKRVPVRSCKMKFDSMFGETEASSLLRTGLFYVAYRSGWATIQAARTAEEREQEASERAKKIAESDNNPEQHDKEGAAGSNPGSNDLQKSHTRDKNSDCAGSSVGPERKRSSEGEVCEILTCVSSTESLTGLSSVSSVITAQYPHNSYDSSIPPRVSRLSPTSLGLNTSGPYGEGSSTNAKNTLQEDLIHLSTEGSPQN